MTLFVVLRSARSRVCDCVATLAIPRAEKRANLRQLWAFPSVNRNAYAPDPRMAAPQCCTRTIPIAERTSRARAEIRVDEVARVADTECTPGPGAESSRGRLCQRCCRCFASKRAGKRCSARGHRRRSRARVCRSRRCRIVSSGFDLRDGANAWHVLAQHDGAVERLNHFALLRDAVALERAPAHAEAARQTELVAAVRVAKTTIASAARARCEQETRASWQHARAKKRSRTRKEAKQPRVIRDTNVSCAPFCCARRANAGQCNIFVGDTAYATQQSQVRSGFNHVQAQTPESVVAESNVLAIGALRARNHDHASCLRESLQGS